MHASSHIANDQKRAVLYPQSTPESEIDREIVAKLLIFCGADPMRHIDQSYSDLDEDSAFLRYINYISRIDDDTLSRAIVLLHKTESVPYGILKPRQILTSRIPQLASALWCVYIDVVRDPFVIHNLQVVGRIVGLKDNKQMFVDYRKNHYLLLRSDCDYAEVLRENAQQLCKDASPFVDREQPTSRQVPSEEPPPSVRDTYESSHRPSSSRSLPSPVGKKSGQRPSIRTRPKPENTGYRFCSEVPAKPKSKIG